MTTFTYEEKNYKNFSEELFYDVHGFVLYSVGGEENLWSNDTLTEIYKENKDGKENLEKVYQVCKDFLEFLHSLNFENDNKIIKMMEEMVELVFEMRKDKIKEKMRKLERLD